MPRPSESVRKQIERMLRLMSMDPSKGAVFYDDPDTGETGYIMPEAPDPAPIPEDMARVHRESFEDQDTWEVNHGLGASPVVTVWTGSPRRFGFGTQPFGTSMWGGGLTHRDVEEATDEPIITRISPNRIKIEWNEPTDGEVICVG